MKTKKKYFYWKKFNFLFFKIFLWACVGLAFINISILIPPRPNYFINELIVFLCLVLVINVHTSIIYPSVSKKSNLFYYCILICSIIFCVLFEIMVFSKNINASYFSILDRKKIYFVTFCYISIRDIFLFFFFLWVEYFNRLIHFYHKQEIIHQKEMSLLIEKQNFEKQFSRKKLLPHYFLNILEYFYVKSLINNNDDNLFEKLKFTLYYFLVDAEKEVIELDKEIEFYKYYIDLEEFKCQEKISVCIDVVGQTEKFFIIPLLYEPIISNAMKYSKHDGSGWVDVKIDASQFPVLDFHCKNNFEPHSENRTSSENGLKILKQRLDLCYKDNYTLTIVIEDNVYVVSLSIKGNILNC